MCGGARRRTLAETAKREDVMSVQIADSGLKARHRAMWGSATIR